MSNNSQDYIRVHYCYMSFQRKYLKMNSCRSCGVSLSGKRGDGGVKKRSVETKLKGHGLDCSVSEGIKSSLNVTITPGRSVCETCFKHIGRVAVLSAKVSSEKQELSAEKKKLVGLAREKPIFSPSPTAKRMCFSPKMSSTPRKTKISLSDTVTNHLKQYNYATAYRAMYRGSKKARKDLHKVVEAIIRGEVKTFSNRLSTFRQELTLETIEKFNWNSLLRELESGLPLASTVVKAALTSTRSKDKVSCIGKKIGPLLPAFGLLLGVILHQRFPTKFKFLQQIISIQMFRSGCNHKMFKWFKKFGLCMSVDATRRLVDKLGKYYDNKIKEWKGDIEQHILGGNPQPIPGSDAPFSDEDDWSSVSEDDIQKTPEDDTSEDEVHNISVAMEETVLYSESDDDFQPLPDISIPESIDVKGFSVCWDNVQKMSVARHHSRKHGNKMMLWANCFATKDRISFNHLNENWDTTLPAGRIDIDKILPGDTEWYELQCRMEILVQRTLVKILELDVDTQDHIQHQYSAESCKKSEVVNLGVLKENPSTCQGVIQIMKYLHRYVPRHESGKVWPIICHGDQLSVERMIEGKVAMSSSREPSDRLEGLIPRPQNFHKRVILLQGTLDMLFGKGAGDKGTLMQLKNYFGHRNVKKKASDCMNHLTDFIEFVTEGHLMLLGTHLRGTDKLCDVLSSTEDVEALSREIVRFVWPTMDNYMADIEEERHYSCICNNDEGGDDWVECSSRSKCNTRWFHQQCVDVNNNIEDEDWWCSNECKERGLSAYCCGKQKGDSWIKCQSGEKCVRNEWFHTSCVGATELSSWYCSEVCRTAHSIDHKQAYAMTTLWRGLLHLVEKDAERENDGSAMITLWRLNLLEFWEYGHYKYLTLAFRLLASVNGWMPERIAQNLIWNSTANLRGEPGTNIPLDLLNEFLNNEFKTNLRRVRGQYTDLAVHRCSLIAGTVGQGLEERFMTQVIDKYVSKGHSTHTSHKKDLKKFVKVFIGEKLFACLPGRQHSGYPGFVHKLSVKQPSKLRDRLLKYSVQIDTQRLLTK